MTSLDSGWGGATRQQGGQFLNPANHFGETASNALTYAGNSGPYFPGGGSELGQKPSRDAALAPFLGMPSKEDVQDPYDAYDVENYQLPDGFVGKRPYLKYIILKGITAEEQYPYREMMPFRKNDSSIEIMWDVWRFNNHMLGRTPEESVSRMLTMNISQSRESMVRYGIALMLEHGFYKTEKGRLNYRMNLEQIMHATATTLAYGAMYHVLHSTYVDPQDKYRKKQSRGILQIAQLFREELDNWAIVQKTEQGWSVIYDKCQEKLTMRNGKPGNYTVVPAGTRKYLEGRPENNYFVYNGFPGGKNPNPMPAKGSVLRESVGYRVGEHQPNDDPCIRERTIGGFMHIPIPDPGKEKFNTSMMDCEFYSEDKDDYHHATLKDWYRNFGLFDWDTPSKTLTTLGEDYFSQFPNKTWGEMFERFGITDKVVKTVQNLSPEKRAKWVELLNKTSRVKHNTSQSSSRRASNQHHHGRDDHEEENYDDVSSSQQQPRSSNTNNTSSSSSSSSSSKAPANQQSGMTQAVLGYAKDAAADNRLLNSLLTAAGGSALESTQMSDAAVVEEFRIRALNRGVNDIELYEFVKILADIQRTSLNQLNNNKQSLVKMFNQNFNKPDKCRSVTVPALPPPTDQKKLDEMIVLMQESLLVVDIYLCIQELKTKKIAQTALELYWMDRIKHHEDVIANINKPKPKPIINLKNIKVIDVEVAQNTKEVQQNLKTQKEKTDKEQRAKDLTSIWLRTDGVKEGNSPVKLWNSLHNPDGVSISDKEFELTITCTSIVLFKMESAEMDRLADLGGMADIATIDNMPTTSEKKMLKPLTNDTSRFSLLRFSICISAVFNALITYIQSHNNTAELKLALFEKVKKLVPLGSRNAQFRTDLEKHAAGLKTLVCQHQMHNVTILVRDLVLYVLQNSPETPVPASTTKELDIRIDACVTNITEFWMGSIQPMYRMAMHSQVGGASFLTPSVQRATAEKEQSAREHSEDAYKAHRLLVSAAEKEAPNALMSVCGELRKTLPGQIDKIELCTNLNLNAFIDSYKFARLVLGEDMGRWEVIMKSVITQMVSHKPPDKRTPVRYGLQCLLYALEHLDDDDIFKDAASLTTAFKDIPSHVQSMNQLKKKRNDIMYNIIDNDSDEGNTYIDLSDMFTTEVNSVNHMGADELFSDFNRILFKESFDYDVDRSKADRQEFIDNATDNDSSMQISILYLFTNKTFVCSDSYFLKMVNLIYNDRYNTPAGTQFFTDVRAKRMSIDAARQVATAMITKDAGNNNAEHQDSYLNNTISDKDIAGLMLNAEIVDGQLVEFALDNNIYPFWSVLCFTPHQRYMMGTMIHMNAYGEAGYTFYGHADFQLADNVAQKTHYGHFTMCAKTVTLHPEYIVHAANVICKDYLGGNGHRIWNPSNVDHVEAYRANELDCDIFAVPVAPNWAPEASFMDISGRFNERLMPNAEARRATDYGYMASLLCEVWGWRSVISPMNREHFSQYAGKFNTIVFQQHMKLYNTLSGKLDRYVIGRGHWGGKISPGVGEVHRGAAMYIPNVDYDNTRQSLLSI